MEPTMWPAGEGPWHVTSGPGDPDSVERLLRLLPGWFGIESAIDEYLTAARELPAYLAWPGGGAARQPAGSQPAGSVAAGSQPAGSVAAGSQPAGSVAAGSQPAGSQPIGVLLAARHFPCSAEIYLMAVNPAVHRRGIGRCLVRALEADLVADKVEFLQVKTLGPSRPDAGYERTRRFYAAMGFRPLEELADLWPENPCLIMVKALGRGDGPRPPADEAPAPARRARGTVGSPR